MQRILHPIIDIFHLSDTNKLKKVSSEKWIFPFLGFKILFFNNEEIHKCMLLLEERKSSQS
ncbi:MAG: hypothetical protein A2X70_04390 [Alphaproteobacteria bacterium GWC2_42_16]|nr:MAG: hypothetical protein A2X70_04390 [Alphaproteobacteria bacterium GWC2_42_16]OFW73322.1 MAG: hypothetical protein A2Z80_07480 [Alphaproteobacteria bacterium GWA2_41_27]OFW81788.1 MAG: hypothetical protein A3E50_02745 [Alphaproteobacteria bacterium RIFCSPHIGHO2_12_FULL_42_100]OFW85693.1 MAG: hypothetical protein A2W06_06485 [Alphaproteobacteria bacterium RBG_16_42_14]OFW90814.1 MAG: hypothetical protein A3C41_01815 [Alphaproteobacteria bacterium RIFCSPHIGHO2_02_FULL_42_30]OFW92435.1 MAG: 